MSSSAVASSRTIESDIPARLDRLPWSRWHWMILIGLGTVWIAPQTLLVAALPAA